MKNKLSRRDFLKVLIAGTLYTASRPIFAQPLLGSYDVGIAVGQAVERAVRRAIDLVGGIRRYVKPGDKVKAGDTLLVMEAMKMENNIFAEKAGKVHSIKVEEGDTVLQNDVLLLIE